MRVTFVLISVLFIQAGFSQTITEKDLGKHFDRYGVDGCFLLFNHSDDEFIVYNADLCDSGYIPASTFKIPNSLIALEEGVIKDTNQIIRWDGREWPNTGWNQDQTLKSAIQYSCVWAYVWIAEQVGIDKYMKYVKLFDYGNKNLAGPPTRFWLAGSFRISAAQQVDFLRRFYNNELPVSRKSVDIVKDIIILEKTGSYKLSGKTGGGMISDTEYIMWLVGYVEREDKTWFYAMNFKTNNFDKTSQARYEITKSILSELKLME